MRHENRLAALLRALAWSVEGNLGEVILRGALASSDARFIMVHRADAGALRLLAHAGLASGLAQRYNVIPLAAPTPMTDALRHASHYSIDAKQCTSTYPLAAQLAQTLRGARPSITVRVLRRAGIPTGTFTIGLASTPTDTGEWRDRLDGLTDALSLWSSGAEAPTFAMPSTPTDSISPRQREILALVSDGLTNPQIAERLGVSVATVKSELSWLFTLLGAERRSELAGRAIRARV